MPLLGEVDLPLDLPIWIFNNRNLKLPFLATRCLYQGVDLPPDLPIWALIVKIWNCHSWPLDASTGGGRSATWSAYMSFNNRNQKLPFLATRCLYQGGRSATWSAYMNFNNRNPKLPFLVTRCLYQGGRSATWSAYMSSNNKNMKLPFLATRCLYQGGYICHLICLYLSSNNRNQKLPFLTIRYLYQGVDLPLDLPIWTLTIEIRNCHSWPYRCLYQGRLDLPLDLPIWNLTIEIWNCHSWPLDASTRGVDLPPDMPVWTLTIEIWNCHSWPLDASTGGVGRSATWSAILGNYEGFNNRISEIAILGH